MVSEALYTLLVISVALERLVELRIAARNRCWALKHGGTEVGQEHFAWMKVLHTGFLCACVCEVWLLGRPFLPWIGWPMLAFVLLAQGLRYWVIQVLGKAWNVRVVIVPKMPVCDRGPYRYVRHPNYLAVVAEGIAIPMVHSAYLSAILFSVLNAWMLTVRIRCEEQALRSSSDYAARLGRLGRLLPHRADRETR